MFKSEVKLNSWIESFWGSLLLLWTKGKTLLLQMFFASVLVSKLAIYQCVVKPIVLLSKKQLFCVPKQVLLRCKRACFGTKKGSYRFLIKLFLQN